MKKSLKSIIICICVFYFILSVGYTIIGKGYYSEVLESYNEDTMLNKYYLENTEQKIESLKSLARGNIYCIDINIFILIISACVGTLVGLMISAKENTVAKYILFFIFGNILYSLVWTGIAWLVESNMKIYNIDFITLYKDTARVVLMSYILLYIAIIAGIIMNNKKQVEELNETLKNKRAIKESKLNNLPVRKVLITATTLVVLVFIGVIARRSIILINYSKKVESLSENKNYYVKQEYSIGKQKEIYIKNGIIVEKYSDIDNSISMTYINADTQEYIIYNYNTMSMKQLDYNKYVNRTSIYYNFTNRFYVGTKTRIWGNIVLAFRVNIKTEKYNGNKCYVIKSNNDTDLYLDQETYLNVKEEDTVNSSSVEYTYEFGNVTDEDVAKPLGEWKLIED